MKCERINSKNRDLINEFIKEHWYTTMMIIRGKREKAAEDYSCYNQ